jgi:hypothetical protein
MTPQQFHGYQAIFTAYMNREPVDPVQDFEELKAELTTLRFSKTMAEGLANSILIAKAREEMMMLSFRADTAEQGRVLMEQTYERVLSNFSPTFNIDTSNRSVVTNGSSLMEGELNVNYGQVANQGGNRNEASVTNMTQAVGSIDGDVNWDGIVSELAKVREAAEAEIESSDDPEHHMTTGAIKAAEAAAHKKDAGKLSEYLHKAGSSLSIICEKVGAPLLLAYLKARTGLDGH